MGFDPLSKGMLVFCSIRKACLSCCITTTKSITRVLLSPPLNTKCNSATVHILCATRLKTPRPEPKKPEYTKTILKPRNVKPDMALKGSALRDERCDLPIIVLREQQPPHITDTFHLQECSAELPNKTTNLRNLVVALCISATMSGMTMAAARQSMQDFNSDS